MRIIIVGCGKVGSELAAQLSSEGHDLTLIDLSERRLETLSTTLDVAAVDLSAALDALGEITGETMSEKVIDEVFARFCVGK